MFKEIWRSKYFWLVLGVFWMGLCSLAIGLSLQYVVARPYLSLRLFLPIIFVFWVLVFVLFPKGVFAVYGRLMLRLKLKRLATLNEMHKIKLERQMKALIDLVLENPDGTVITLDVPADDERGDTTYLVISDSKPVMVTIPSNKEGDDSSVQGATRTTAVPAWGEDVGVGASGLFSFKFTEVAA